MTIELEPISPEDAVELYLADKESDFAAATQRSHRSRLQYFVQWCHLQDFTNLNDLTGRDLQQYRLWRRADGDLAPASEKTQMDTIRVFIRWCETVNAHNYADTSRSAAGYSSAAWLRIAGAVKKPKIPIVSTPERCSDSTVLSTTNLLTRYNPTDP